jgi:ComF family protein
MKINLGRDLVDLLYPNTCDACKTRIAFRPNLFCTSCLYYLPFTNFNSFHSNSFTRHFYGRIDIGFGTALFYYLKGGHVPQMIKRIKYQGDKNLALNLGKELGKQINQSDQIEKIDAIIPVPMYRKKQKKRGYNQAELIARGTAKRLSVPVYTDILIKSADTSSLTSMTRNERIAMHQQSFHINALNQLDGKHILLLDDVLTTGATLEACGIEILKGNPSKLSMATLAIGYLK